ncbi:MAG: glycosyl hydrolase family 65 protein, partial [Planctomycetota bacterium]
AFSRLLKRACWDYYEPRTTHDSSLSASVHSVVASDLGLRRKAYEYFRLTASTDLADPMGNTAEGLHAAALGGTWQAAVRGFLGARSAGGALRLTPRLPEHWRAVSLRLRHRGARFAIHATRDETRVDKLGGKQPSIVRVGSEILRLPAGRATTVAR